MRRCSARARRPSVAVGRPLLLAGALLLAGLPAAPEAAQAQDPAPCDKAVPEAHTHFLFGRFDAAGAMLEACLLREAFSKDDKPAAYELLAQIYEASGQEATAKAALAALLAADPRYEPDPDLPASFKDLVDVVRSTRTATPLVETPPAEPPVAVTVAATQGDAARNVRLRQDGDRLVITYDLIGTAKRYDVRLLLSTDGGRSFDPLPQTVAGDVGKGVQRGAGKEITWAVVQDYPQGLAGAPYRVQVDAQKRRGRGLLYVLGGALVAGGGAAVALLVADGGGQGGATDLPLPPGRPPGE